MNRGAWQAGYHPPGLKESDNLAKFIDFIDLIKELPLFINFLYFLFSILLISALTFFLLLILALFCSTFYSFFEVGSWIIDLKPLFFSNVRF